jgi:hypothetical protein
MYKGKRIPGHLYLMNDLIIITYLEDPKQKDVGHVLISSTPLSKTLAVKDNGGTFSNPFPCFCLCRVGDSPFLDTIPPNHRPPNTHLNTMRKPPPFLATAPFVFVNLG